MDTHQQKISHLKALYHLACADNSLTEIEAVYIKNVAEHVGISLEELAKFDPDEPTLELPDREYKNYALFHRLALIIMIDNELDKQEKKYCFDMGIKMGHHPNAVGEIIDCVAANGTQGTLPSEVMAIFKKYLS